MFCIVLAPFVACTEPLRRPTPLSVSIEADRVVRASTVRVEVVVKAEAEISADGTRETWAADSRQQQLLARLAKGASEKEIAYDLGLSAHATHDLVEALHGAFWRAQPGRLRSHVRESSAARTSLRVVSVTPL